MNVDLSGKVVFVAGGTGGLGRSVSLAFLAEAAKVVVTYRRPEEFDELKLAAGVESGRLEGTQVDITDEQAVATLASEILKRHGRIDVVVNTVGGYAGGLKLWETDSMVFDKMLDLNLRSGFALARATMPAMLGHGNGVFINVGAKAAFDHAAGAAAYAASKAAAVAMMDCLAADAQGTGVRVNSILPSIIDTAANRRAMPGAPFDKWPKPVEIARVILFLASDAARVIHGASVPVYGNY
ncbi:MAG: SDR family NAD(P)-dependent oxidoreductase [Acidobacteria bacterium]|nr:SDR family NAD(P)-dependent oxidoreductase [Acidobacteriota bacterium]